MGVTAHAGAEVLLTGLVLKTKLKLLSLLFYLSECLYLGCSSSGQLMMFKLVGIIYYQIQNHLSRREWHSGQHDCVNITNSVIKMQKKKAFRKVVMNSG